MSVAEDRLKNCICACKIALYIAHVSSGDWYNCMFADNLKCNGGMQDINHNHNVTNEGNLKYVKEMKTLTRLFGDSINKEELQQKIEHYNGNIELVIKYLVQQSLETEVKNKLEAEIKTNELEDTDNVNKKKLCLSMKQGQENKMNEINDNNNSVQKEMHKTEIGETKPGINLQGYCTNETCLASKARLPVWINIEYVDIIFISDKTSFCCPDCKKSTVTSIVKAMFYNSEHSICASGDLVAVEDNNYQCSYSIKPGLSYELKANRIKQHAKSIEDLRERSENAMNSIEIKNLVTELQKYEITVVRPPSLKGNERLLEKIQSDYCGDFNQAFDIGRVTILCDSPTKLQTAVAVMKKAEQFNLIVSEDRNFFDEQSKTHHRVHNIKLYVPKHDVYIEMQATLKQFTTLEGYTIIENPKLSHLFYELIRSWRPNSLSEEELKQESNETLAKINDVICEWIDTKEIKKISNRYKPHSEIQVLKPPQLKEISEEQINSKKDTSLKLTQFVYDQLCTFNPKQMKGQAIYVILFEFFKKYIMGEMNPTTCADVASILCESKKQELEEDTAMLQALETYIPLQANNYPCNDDNANEKNDSYDCHQHILDLLTEKKEEKKNEQQIVILQGKSGSGKSLFCRHLEETLWEAYENDFTASIPVYISLPKCYNELNEKQIISQALQMKQLNKEIVNVIRESTSFVFILDGFDEIFDKYNKNKNNDNEKYFYNRFNLNEWNAKIIINCRSNVLSDDDINQVLISSNNWMTSMIYLWPFSKEQMNGYIDKFVKMNKKNKMNDNLDWTTQQYEETLQSYPNLHKMMEEPFLLRLILTVLPSLIKQHPIKTDISKSQIYEAFNEQWIDIHVKNISNKLSELRMQTNFKRIKSSFQQYCQNLGFEMFLQGNTIATENCDNDTNNEILSKLDPTMETEIKNIDENMQTKEMDKNDDSIVKKKFWNKYFSSNNITRHVPRRKEDDNNQTVNEDLEKKTNEINISGVKTQDVWEKYFNADSIAKYILRRIGDNKYQFLHKSCQEYYAAQKIIFDIISWKPNIIGIVDIDNKRFQQQFETHVQKLSINCRLLNEELGIIQFIAERIHEINPIFVNLKSRLFRIIEASKNNENVSIAAANAVTILNSANVNMHYRNWDNIKIPHAILDRAFLEGTDFTNANLDHVRFYQAFLSKVNFTNASMNRIYFGEYAYLEGHSDNVIGVQFSPDGSKILSYSRDKSIRIWNTQSGKQLHLLQGHSNWINSAQFSPDGSKIVSCSRDKTVRVWDVLSGQQIQIFEHSKQVNAVQFSPDGLKIVSGLDDDTIPIWDALSGKQLQLLNGHLGIISGIQFSPDGSKLVSCSNDKTIHIWDVFSGKSLQILRGHLRTINGIQFTSDGSKVISCSIDRTIRIWDVFSGQQIQAFEGHSDAINGIQLSSDNSKILSYSNDKTIRIWDILSGKQIQILEGHSEKITSARFSLDSSKIVSASSDKTVRIWDISSKKQLQVLEGHLGGVCGIDFFPKDHKILSCSNDGTIRIWDMALERKIQLIEEYLDDVTDVQFSPDGSKIVSCSQDKTVRLWDVRSGNQIYAFEGHSGGVRGVLFSLNGSKIISCSSDNTIRIWDVLSNKQLHVLEGHSDYITAIQISSDDSKIVSCSIDNTVRIWDILSGKQLQLNTHAEGVTCAQFFPDGSKVVSCSYDKTIRIWNVLSGRQILILEGHLKSVSGIQISPDCSKVISWSWDKTFRLWDLSSGNQLLSFEDPDWIIKACFSPDGKKIISCSLDKMIRLWDVSSGKQLQVFEGHSAYIREAQFFSDGSKIISYADDKTIRIWDILSGKQIQLLEGHNRFINGIKVSPDDSKLISCSNDKTIRLWGSGNNKIFDVTENSLIKCIWRRGVQSGLSMKYSIWKDAKGLTVQQKLLVEQRGGIF
ncbi:WD-40 repeat protein [Reticulomyxa filosa]|uniref:WD-40 repeat protein n=1 Tax=Reticulomyxa filosa TaxID=46433 RepID=X6NDZ8_RETFI|nr:WD-40 repeat protein [Reticulomyxa filosa]|eukprot:ETO24550.1 WD-40 repeat protein [Reticulomyxa filosa]